MLHPDEQAAFRRVLEAEAEEREDHGASSRMAAASESLRIYPRHTHPDWDMMSFGERQAFLAGWQWRLEEERDEKERGDGRE